MNAPERQLLQSMYLRLCQLCEETSALVVDINALLRATSEAAVIDAIALADSRALRPGHLSDLEVRE